MSATSQSSPVHPLLASAHAAGALLVVPVDRAAATLRHVYDSQQRELGLSVWQAADVLSWTSWLGGLWNTLVVEGHETRLLMNGAQEQMLWRKIIDADPVPTLDSTASLAALAASAWDLAAAWSALPELRRYTGTRDAARFAEWARAFTALCSKQQALSPAMLPAALAEHAAAGRLSLRGPVLLAGFDDLTPTQQALLTALRAAGADIHQQNAAPTPQATLSVLKSDDEGAEFHAALQWVRRFLEVSSGTVEESSDATPARRVALILPDAQQQRAAIEPMLRAVLAPELQDISADTSTAPWSFGGGVPLAQTAAVDTALTLLRWLIAPLHIERVTSMLLSPYLGEAGSMEIRAEFDAFVLRERDVLRPELTIVELQRLARRTAAPLRNTAGPLADFARLEAVQRSLASGEAQRSHADWMQFIRAALRSAGWPGTRALTLSEAATLRAWDHVLDLVATLDFAVNTKRDLISFSAALDALEQAAGSAPSSTTLHAAPIQIFTPAEAVNVLPIASFDAIVFLRTTEDNWPPSERSNPLLSFALQQALGMPGTDAAREAVRAQRLTTHLLAAAPNAVFSYAARDAAGEQRLSPLIAALHLPVTEARSATAQLALVAEELVADTAPLPPLLSPHVSGGAKVLQLQAACGFQAFASLRLEASSPRRHDAGFDPRQSGNVVHLALQKFWEEVGSHATLLDLSEDERSNALLTAIDHALARQPTPEIPWDNAYLALQRQRLFSLLHAWLGFELRRGPFTVLQREAKREVRVGPLTLSVRLDRVDEVELNGERGYVLVDYKTGAAATKDWNPPRPDEPQLPLYTLLLQPNKVQAIAFANLRAGSDMQWNGFASQPGILPTLPRANPADLSAQIALWRAELERLAAEFAEGRAEVAPKSYIDTCKRCGLQMLCRVDRASQQDDDEGEGADDA